MERYLPFGSDGPLEFVAEFAVHCFRPTDGCCGQLQDTGLRTERAGKVLSTASIADTGCSIGNLFPRLRPWLVDVEPRMYFEIPFVLSKYLCL
jgi:hypothetical protein